METAHKDCVISVETDLPFTEVINRTRDLLQAAGYGVEADGNSLREGQVI
jgi:hypothetical protein